MVWNWDLETYPVKFKMNFRISQFRILEVNFLLNFRNLIVNETLWANKLTNSKLFPASCCWVRSPLDDCGEWRTPNAWPPHPSMFLEISLANANLFQLPLYFFFKSPRELKPGRFNDVENWNSALLFCTPVLRGLCKTSHWSVLSKSASWNQRWTAEYTFVSGRFTLWSVGRELPFLWGLVRVLSHACKSLSNANLLLMDCFLLNFIKVTIYVVFLWALNLLTFSFQWACVSLGVWSRAIFKIQDCMVRIKTNFGDLRETWLAAVHGVAKSRTRLSDWKTTKVVWLKLKPVWRT